MNTKLNENTNNPANILNFVDMVIRKPEEEEAENENKDKPRKDISVGDVIDIQALNDIEKKNKELKEESVKRSRENLRISKRSESPKRRTYEKIDYDFKEVNNEILKKNVKKSDIYNKKIFLLFFKFELNNFKLDGKHK